MEDVTGWEISTRGWAWRAQGRARRVRDEDEGGGSGLHGCAQLLPASLASTAEGELQDGKVASPSSHPR